jgi:hypothetical protein
MSEKLVIKVNKQDGFSDEQFKKYLNAIELTQKVINAKRF